VPGDSLVGSKDRKFYRVGEVWGTESERELTRRCSIETRLSDYGMFSLKAGLISDSGSHWLPYRDLYT